jgi:hypothetical protein
MKRAYKFIAGNSRITPVGIAVAVVAALVLRGGLGAWTGVVYVGILALTLAIATGEPVE